MIDLLAEPVAPLATTRRPRIGFLGVGWIGRHRMEAILATGRRRCGRVADPSAEMTAEALRLAPGAEAAPTWKSCWIWISTA
jgi:predicted dehydrogenase